MSKLQWWLHRIQYGGKSGPCLERVLCCLVRRHLFCLFEASPSHSCPSDRCVWSPCLAIASKGTKTSQGMGNSSPLSLDPCRCFVGMSVGSATKFSWRFADGRYSFVFWKFIHIGLDRTEGIWDHHGMLCLK